MNLAELDRMYVVDVAEYGIRMLTLWPKDQWVPFGNLITVSEALELAKKNSWNFWACEGADLQCFLDTKKLNDSVHLPSEFLSEYIVARLSGRAEPWDTEHAIDNFQKNIFSQLNMVFGFSEYRYQDDLFLETMDDPLGILSKGPIENVFLRTFVEKCSCELTVKHMQGDTYGIYLGDDVKAIYTVEFSDDDKTFSISDFSYCHGEQLSQWLTQFADLKNFRGKFPFYKIGEAKNLISPILDKIVESQNYRDGSYILKLLSVPVHKGSLLSSLYEEWFSLNHEHFFSQTIKKGDEVIDVCKKSFGYFRDDDETFDFYLLEVESFGQAWTKADTDIFYPHYCLNSATMRLPDHAVTRIAKGAFKDIHMCSLTIPDSIVEIEDGAFENVDGLEECIIPEHCVYSDNAFVNCPHTKREYQMCSNFPDSKPCYATIEDDDGNDIGICIDRSGYDKRMFGKVILQVEPFSDDEYLDTEYYGYLPFEVRKTPKLLVPTVNHGLSQKQIALVMNYIQENCAAILECAAGTRDKLP